MDEDVSVSLLFLSTLLSIFFQFSVVKEHTEMTPQCLASSVPLENIRKVVVQRLVLIVDQGIQLKHSDLIPVLIVKVSTKPEKDIDFTSVS
jgi:hypothetical protein